MQGVPHAESVSWGMDKRLDKLRQVVPALAAELSAIVFNSVQWVEAAFALFRASCEE